jgi:hypothetical protein
MGLKTYFAFVRGDLQKKIRRSNQRSLVYGVGAFFLIFASYSLSVISSNPLLSTVFEVVAIGGWVFLWEAISTFAFHGRLVLERFKMYQRFSTAEIRFTYAQAT